MAIVRTAESTATGTAAFKPVWDFQNFSSQTQRATATSPESFGRSIRRRGRNGSQTERRSSVSDENCAHDGPLFLLRWHFSLTNGTDLFNRAKHRPFERGGSVHQLRTPKFPNVWEFLMVPTLLHVCIIV